MTTLNTKQIENNGKPHVVVLGGGFAGISAVKQLRKAPVDITLIDRRNHHLFQPLLYQVATAGLSAPDIAQPLRHIFANQRNITTLMDEVTSVDVERRCIEMKEHALGYDFLIFGLGAQTGFFGNDHWEEHTLGLKTLNEATDFRPGLPGWACTSSSLWACETGSWFFSIGSGPT